MRPGSAQRIPGAQRNRFVPLGFGLSRVGRPRRTPATISPADAKSLLGEPKITQVMMYCTGGIRCERATALLDQLEKASSAEGGDFRTEGVVMVRGGIERYVKTFPEGGFWKVLGPVLTPQP